MKVLLFGANNAPLMKAMAEGMLALGHSVAYRNNNVYREGDYEPCDAAALFSLHGPGQALLRDYKRQGTPVVVVDYGFVRRGTPHEGRNNPSKYYFSVGLNGLNGHADFRNHLMPGDRWKALGAELNPWKADGKYILVCGQKTADVAIGNIIPRVWAQKIISEIQQITTRPVLFRPHPMDPSQKRPIGVPHSEHHTIEEALKDAFALVAYNSNSLVDALIAGVPAFALGPGSMVSAVANTDLAQLEDPYRPDRMQFFHDLAYCQWTINEMKTGAPWVHLFAGTPQGSESATEESYESARVQVSAQSPKDNTSDGASRARIAKARPHNRVEREHALSTGE